MSGPRLEANACWSSARARSDPMIPRLRSATVVPSPSSRRGRVRPWCADRDAASAEETAKLVTDESGVAETVVADISSEDDCRSLIASTLEGGPLDALVLNVGIGRGEGLAHTSADDWDITFAPTCAATSSSRVRRCR